jgi:hypothetical protein
VSPHVLDYNLILYTGLCLISTGLVVTALLGLEDTGFRAIELKLIGPAFVVWGAILVLLRILLFTVPSFDRTDDGDDLAFKRKLVNQDELFSNDAEKDSIDIDVGDRDENPLIHKSVGNVSRPQLKIAWRRN